jgi:ATP-dependent 26S proteasome regulatory subunit
VIATTNAAGNIDTAFQRRMDVVVPFHLPDAEQRYLLWRLHLPPGHTVSDAMLEEMAVRHPFTGGQIRNAAIHATVVAFQSNRESVDDTAVVAAVEAEHRKAGASHPRVETQDPASPEHDLAAFLSAIT